MLPGLPYIIQGHELGFGRNVLTLSPLTDNVERSVQVDLSKQSGESSGSEQLLFEMYSSKLLKNLVQTSSTFMA